MRCRDTADNGNDRKGVKKMSEIDAQINKTKKKIILNIKLKKAKSILELYKNKFGLTWNKEDQKNYDATLNFLNNKIVNLDKEIINQ